MKLSETFFKYRSYTPLPFVAVMLIFQQPNVWGLIAGFIIAAAGEFIRFWGVSWAGSETRTTGNVGGTFLIVNGPFCSSAEPAVPWKYNDVYRNWYNVICTVPMASDSRSFIFWTAVSSYC